LALSRRAIAQVGIMRCAGEQLRPALAATPASPRPSAGGWPRRRLLRLLGGAGLAAASAPLLAGCALLGQQAPRVPRVGVLLAGRGDSSPSLDAFRLGMRERGYVEGQNVVYEVRFSGDETEGLVASAAELVRLGVDVIVTGGTVSIQAARAATSTIPIVMASSGDPVATGLVASLARPGGNVTGLTLISPELSGKRLELLKETLPTLTRVAFLTEPANAASRPLQEELEAAGRILGVEIDAVPIHTAADLDGAFAAARGAGAQGLMVFGGAVLLSERARIADLAVQHRLPAMYQYAEFADAGGLMSYGLRVTDLWRRAAIYVDRVLRGAAPAELPVERPMHFALLVNLKAAQAIDLAVPRSVLEQATTVLQ
jgi:putative ABC transport system substrate-binding protein